MSYNLDMKKSLLVHSEDPVEIKSILLEAHSCKKEFIVWQRNAEGKVLFQGTGQLIKIASSGSLQFEILKVELGSIHEIETFFATEDSGTIFKSIHVKIKSENKLNALLPSEAKYRDRRKHERTVFKASDQKEVEVQLDNQKIHSKIIDFSESGACFLVSKTTLKNIELDSTVLITSLTSFEITHKRAKVMNARNYNNPTLSHEEFYAIGVMFY